MARKAKKEERSPEEIREYEFNQEIREAQRLPEPSYFFDIGDEVEIGNLKDVFVVDISASGKVYEIDYTSVDTNYGHPVASYHKRRFVNWLEIRPVTTLQHRNLIKNEDLQLQFFQTTVDGLLSRLYGSGINMNPVYQRGYVWNESDEQALINSIFHNADIGKFVVIRTEELDFYYEILDGKQRLHALSRFYENRFSYNGLFFNDLDREEKHQFKDFPISIGELYNITEQQKYRYFVTLNQHGRAMTQEDLNRVYEMIATKEL